MLYNQTQTFLNPVDANDGTQPSRPTGGVCARRLGAVTTTPCSGMSSPERRLSGIRAAAKVLITECITVGPN